MTADRSALVVGGSRGIGRAVTARLLDDGWGVTATGRDRTVLAELERDLLDTGPVRTAVLDATDPDQVAGLAGTMADLDLLVYNAGTSSAAPLQRTSLEDWDAQVAVNATGAFLTLRAFVPAMVARGAGRVVVIASTAGLTGSPYISAYCASKHAAVGLVRSVAAEVAGSGVTVNAVCPHFVRTEMTERTLTRIEASTSRTREEALAGLVATGRLGRLIEPDEVAAAVAHLAAADSVALNGHALPLDGGGHW